MKTMLAALAASLALVACGDSIPKDERPPIGTQVWFRLKSGEKLLCRVTKIEGGAIHTTSINGTRGLIKWDDVAQWNQR